MNGTKIVLRVVAALVLLAALAGIAFFAYQAGVVHGSPITVQAPNGQITAPAPYPYYGYGMPWHAFPFFGFGFGCFGPLIALLLVFIAFRAMRFMFWGPGWFGPMGHRHAWRHGWTEEGVPPMFKEMHDRLHGKQPDEQK